MSERLRLRDVDAGVLAARLSVSVLEVTNHQRAVVGADGRLADAIHALTRYAQGHAHQGSVPDHFDVVRRLYASPAVADAPAALEPEPTSELALLVAAVFARQSLDRGRDISAGELALLSGLNHDHVAELARKEAIPSAYRSAKYKRRPWRFRATKALKKWIDDKNA